MGKYYSYKDYNKEIELLNQRSNDPSNPIWKIKENSDRFAVSIYGQVYDLQNHKHLKEYPNKEGYNMVYLGSYGETNYPVLVHRIVAETYLPNPNNYNVVNHIDEDKTNNKVENLEWCTQRHNLTCGTVQERKKTTLSKTIQYRNEVKEANLQIEQLKEKIALLEKENYSLYKKGFEDGINEYNNMCMSLY